MEFTVASPAVYYGIPPRHQHLWCLVARVRIRFLSLAYKMGVPWAVKMAARFEIELENGSRLL